MKFNKTNLAIGFQKRLRDDDGLHRWVKLYCGLDVPRTAVCPHHTAPFQFLHNTYFEPCCDNVVWAPRGGGKTRLAAVATLLDLAHKPDVSVRILGGSLDQSLRTWEHLVPDLEKLCPELIKGAAKAHVVKMKNGAIASVLPQSQRAVRGIRVQKLRCDEVELFDPEIWEAAQLVTRSLGKIRGSIDAISTLHKPWGLMAKLVEVKPPTQLIRWCLLDVLERCPAERSCDGCPLWNECRGIAKTACRGFIRIGDAIAMKQRVSIETWESEMLCLRPSTQSRVFPTFDEQIHVTDALPADSGALQLAMDFGFANAFVCLWIARLPGGGTYVVDEYVQSMQTVDVHLLEIEGRTWGKVHRINCDPAGNGPNEQTAQSNVQLLRSKGYAVRFKRSTIAEGLEQIRRGLKPAWGEPSLFVHPRCVRLRKALAGYHFPVGGGEVPEKDGEHDHLIDALRYYLVNQVRTDRVIRHY